jgi:phosphoribosylanthranilate isomerase
MDSLSRVSAPEIRVKVCGITSVADARMVAQAGAHWIGLNFYSKSPRFVTKECAAEIVRALPPSCEAVGLFVNEPPDEVANTAHRVGLGFVQLHGDEDASDLARLQGLKIVKALRVGNASDVIAARNLSAACASLGLSTFAWLFDAHAPGLLGGTGRIIPFELLGILASEIAQLGRVILAGGLTPENVTERVRAFRPWMVDVASGVELSPGIKDPKRVRDFISAVRAA